MRRYFITGGTGFIGRAIVRKLLRDPDTERITVLTRGHRAISFHDPDLKVDIWTSDVADGDFPKASYYTDCIHAAADANDLLQPDQYYYYYTLVEGTKRILDWAADKGFENFLFVSSGAAVHRETPYGRAKRMGEWFTEQYTHIKIVRIYSVVGEEMPLDGQYALGRFIHSAVTDKCVKYWDAGHQRSYLYIDDVADWLIALLNSAHSGPYDIGGTRVITIGELAHLVGSICGVPVERMATPNVRSDKADIYLPNPVPTMLHLGVHETVTLEEAIRRVHAYVCRTYVEQGSTPRAFSLFDSGASLHSPR